VQLTNTGDVADTSIGGGSTFAVLPGASSLFKPDTVYLGTFGVGTLTLGSLAYMEPSQDLYVGYAAGATGVMSMDGAQRCRPWAPSSATKATAA
jgi:hypothetical protein